MADINNATLIGHLTRDAELSYTPGGMAISSFCVAINRRIKKGEDWVDEANYFDVKAFGKQAESLKPYMTKGKQIGVTGYLRQERWEKDGQKFSKIVLNANDIQLLGGRDNSSQTPTQDQADTGYGYGN